MRLLTILGTRPEIVRLSLIIPKLDELCDQTLVHTGQNYTPQLSDVFMEQLNVREPDYYLSAKGSFAKQLATIITRLERIITKVKPDAFLVLGDTNSSLGAIVAKRMGVKVFHMEAGNRCYDDRVPEEVNRRLIDHASDILMPYTERSRQNLLAEGIPGQRIYVTGNPIKEVLDFFKPKIDAVRSFNDDYFLVTLHRSENVDNPKRLEKIIKALALLDEPVIWPMHPHTSARLDGQAISENVHTFEPQGLFEFVKLEQNAYCVLTDSGTVSEECAIFGVPCVTLRDSTERPETIESGSNFIAGVEAESILKGIEVATSQPPTKAPEEYFVDKVSDTIVKIVLSHWL